jgi:phage terminase large subunit-like protein
MLTALIRNWRHSAELIILAPTIEAAQNSARPAADMVRADPDLSRILHVQDHLRQITHLKTKATLKVLAADSATVVGKKASFVLIDELWEFGNRADADAMLREATGGLVSRPEGFVISISTMADAPPTGVFKAKLDYARNVRDGVIKDTKFMPVIYEFPENMVKSKAYLEPSNFYITNPNIDRSVSREALEDELRKEIAGDPQTRNTFLAKHLNIEIGLALRNDRWRGADFWENAGDDRLSDIDELLHRSEVVTFGVDGGGLDDLLGGAVIGREKETRHWLCWSHAWAHKQVLDIRKDISPALKDFEQEGALTICEAAHDLVAGLGDVFAKVLASGLLPEKDAVGVDPNNVAALIEELTARGMTDGMLRRLLQGPALSPAWWGIEMKLADGTFFHSATRMMAWCVGNAKGEPRGNAVMLTKQISGRAKIDPVIAMGQAAILMSWNPDALGHSIYETRGALIL